MPSNRIGYGYGAYSAADFGVEGVVQDGAAAVTASSSATAVGFKYKFGSATVSASSSASSAAIATFVSGATVSSTASIASVAEEFVLKQSDKFSYGTGTYGSYVYDNADLQTISSATLSATQADYIRIRTVSGSGSASASNSSDSTRVREGAATVAASASIAADGAFTVSASPETIDVTSGVSISYIRKRNAEAIKAAQSVVVAIGREKWEVIPVTSFTWTKLAA
jgi:hypothetical protein